MTDSVFQVASGMPLSVWQNKYARQKPDGSYQSWEERLHEVVSGNFLLDPRMIKLSGESVFSDSTAARHWFEDIADDTTARLTKHLPVIQEYHLTRSLAIKGILPFSGRHLQQGDFSQPGKIGELFTNCSTAAFSFMKFYLLLKASGVGRLYDDDVCFVNWDFMPNTRFVLEGPDYHTGAKGHPDYEPWIEDAREARAKYDGESEHVRWFEVEDSAEGWVSVVSILETAAFHKNNKDHLFVFDFSRVRQRGAPIRGQQNRPASGPVPLIMALTKVAQIKGAGWKPWKQAMFVDHYLSECVAVGGIRRSARIAVKSWKDRDVIEFIDLKRGGFLYTANNSIAVDEEFWRHAASTKPTKARRVFEAAVQAAYHDGTGEPGFLNVDKLTVNQTGIALLADGILSPHILKTFGGHRRTKEMVTYVVSKVLKKQYPYITNPCGEIVLSAWGGYCTIADICLANVDSVAEAICAAEMAARFLIRVNRMSFMYQAEVRRTNRIGVSLTGIHEFAFRQFGLTFQQLVADQPTVETMEFWNLLDLMRISVEKSATEFSRELGMIPPHTFTTIKPSGTISKVMSCTEGAHLPAAPYYMRWVQMPITDPQLAELRDRGYPTKDISTQYRDHHIVGFPTKLPIADLMGDLVTTAEDVTPAQQYTWLERLERTWLGGPGVNNQVSYTLKYNPAQITFYEFMDFLLKHQSNVKCCTVMPQEDTTAYIYQPEEPITKSEYQTWMTLITRVTREAYDPSTLECSNGACPIESDQETSTNEV